MVFPPIESAKRVAMIILLYVVLLFVHAKWNFIFLQILCMLPFMMKNGVFLCMMISKPSLLFYFLVGWTGGYCVYVTGSYSAVLQCSYVIEHLQDSFWVAGTIRCIGWTDVAYYSKQKTCVQVDDFGVSVQSLMLQIPLSFSFSSVQGSFPRFWPCIGLQDEWKENCCSWKPSHFFIIRAKVTGNCWKCKANSQGGYHALMFIATLECHKCHQLFTAREFFLSDF